MIESDKNTSLRPDHAELRYRKMIELASDAIFAIDAASGIVLEANPKAARLTGMSIKELTDLKVWDLHPVGEQKEARQHFEHVRAGGSSTLCDLHLINKNGAPVPVEINTALIQYNGSAIIQRICRDLSERAEMERRNQQLNRTHHNILDMMPVGLGVRRVDGDKKIIFENRKLKELFSDGGEEHDWDWYNCDKDCVEQRYQTVDESGVYAEERKLRDGRVLQFTSSYFKATDDNWLELQVIQDVTIRRSLEEELIEARDDLDTKVKNRTRELQEKQLQLAQAEKMASLGNLVAGVAHEINTPLGALKSNYDLFVRSFVRVRTELAKPKVAKAIDNNELLATLFDSIDKLNRVNTAATERIVKIVDSLRNFARLDRAEMDRVDIHQCIESTITLVQHRFKGRVEVKRYYGQMSQIECYPNQLNQVFMNLLVNASQAIEDKGTITIETKIKGDWIEVAISDDGRGISTENLPKVYDPGFTTKGAGVGTGLGLSIVHQIIQNHSGRIEIESEEGVGTTFRISLPIRQ